MLHSRVTRVGLLLALALIVPACGGGKKGAAPGSGSGTPTPAVVAFASTAVATAEGTTGTATVTLTVNRTGGTGAVSVQYATSDVSATAGADYTAVAGTLTWAAADFTAQTIIVPIADLEGALEGDETFRVTLSAPTGATLGANSVATVTITDGDGPADGIFEFSSLTYDITEGAAATVPVTITVKRTGGSLGAVSVDCVVTGGTATSGADYTAPGTVTLNWADGDAADKTFTIDILNDGVDGAGVETITLALQNPLPVPGPEVSTSIGTATVRILDRDSIGSLQFNAASYSVSESGVQATITVSRIGGGAGAVGVDVALGGGTSTAVAGTDYTNPGAIHLDWVDGDAADKTFVIPVIDNLIGDGNRTLELLLQNPTGGATLGGTNPVVLTITDDEAGVFTFSASTYSVTEGNAGTVLMTITVNRVNGSVGAASVQVAVTGGTATNVTDYTVPAAPVTLNWADGDTAAKTFDITVNGDATFEPDETILLALQNPVGGSLGAPQTAVATILNDDLPPGGTLVLSSTTYAVTEGTPNVVITVNRTGLNALAVTCKLSTINGTAKGNGKNRDFTAQKAVTISLGAGITTQTLNIPITDDAFVEAPETFKVQISTPTGQAVIGTPNTATVTITSND